MKNAVLTCFINLPSLTLERFIKTFRSTNSKDDLVIFLTDFNLSNHNNIFRNYTYEYNCTFCSCPLSFCTSPAELMTKRFFLYENYLKDKKYDTIFLTDIRDVIFQRNLFEYVSDKIVFFSEADLIKNEPINLGMLQNFSLEIQEKVAPNYILCMGTILGKQTEILKFIERFKDIMSNTKIPRNFDQCILNIMVYYKNLFEIPFEIKYNRDGIVNTIGLKQSFRKIYNGFVIDENNNISKVVHQFDRLPKEDIITLSEKQNFPIKDLLYLY